MDDHKYEKILMSLDHIQNQLESLQKETNDNELLLIELLKKNNSQTKEIYDVTIRDKSLGQQTTDFLLNVAANIAGNAIATPTVINLKKYER